ncbi:hypothetical protein Snoj_25840 [Streptomyces nojiriensis]|uniref:Transposase n=1 Tax=Streptomyces nojiriensis TaxID=66374 RepID=A0ABQ3SKJ8_9ACTN|nr:DUF6262 family protein [Streptomyces nojiriensis]QTI50255.1 hypothetical protein JYK04_08131 [Streptomyces nojiriensis]GGS29455.1 hypothetical protein GCM10010205_69440 [Streptomyces nojiriensis]GHI68666.1 hypothetical protein Snoj_25840 [Streptomyces nojiriensis]
MLPPKQVCSTGNACLTCDKFVTDASHRAELEHRLAQTEALITCRQAQFVAHHGEPMGEDNVWLAGRLTETRALRMVDHMSPLPKHLQQATRSRTENAERRARAAVAQLAKVGQPISFAAVARQAGVSTDFLYKRPDLRTLIERHRSKLTQAPAASPLAG